MAQRIREDSASQEYERSVNEQIRSTGAKRASQLAAWCGDSTFAMLPTAYRAALDHANLSGKEEKVMRALENLTIAAIAWKESIRVSTKRLAGLSGIDPRTCERVVQTLVERKIIGQDMAANPNHPQGPVRWINPNFQEWHMHEDMPQVYADLRRPPSVRTFAYPPTQDCVDLAPEVYADFRTHVLDSGIDKEETIKSSSSSAGAHEAIDISLDTKKEQLEDQAILDRLAATVPPEPVRYRPLPKTEQTRRNTTSPGNSPEPAFVAWREAFTTRYKHDPPRMSDDLRRLLLDLSREYPAVIDKVIRGYFGWTKLDEAEIRTKGLEETLEKECAACAGDPARSPFPLKEVNRFQPPPRPSYTAQPQRLTRLDPMDAYKKKRMPPNRTQEVQP